MRRLFKILFTVVFLFLALFIKQEAFAYNNIPSNLHKLVISAPKAKDIALNKQEDYFIVLNGQKREQISSRSGKNNINSSSNNELGVMNKPSSGFIFENNTFNLCYISYNISPRLKNTINTRAP